MAIVSRCRGALPWALRRFWAATPLVMPPKEKTPAAEVVKHVERLKYQDEDWKARDEALEKLRKLITEGALATKGYVDGEAGFAANLKDLVHSIVTQLFDLRSVIARSAANTLEVLMVEVGDHAAAEAPMCGDALEGLLQLSSSANKVLAAAGREVFPKFIEQVRFESIVKDGLLVWLRGNKTPAVKMTCLSSLLQALQTWPLKLLSPSNESLEVALVEAAANPMGEIRVLARACLLQHLLNSPERQEAVDKWLARYPDTKKQMDKEAPRPGGLGADERVMPVIRRGDGGATTRNGKLGAPSSAGAQSAGMGAAAAPAKKPSLLKSLSRGNLSAALPGKKAGAKKKSAANGGPLDDALAALEQAAAALSGVHIDALSSAQAARIRRVATQLEGSLLQGGEPTSHDGAVDVSDEGAPPVATVPAVASGGAAGAGGGGGSAMERMQALRARQHELSPEEYEAARKLILDSV